MTKRGKQTMVDFDDGDTLGVGCVLTLKARGKNEGELSLEELEEIDEQMLKVGVSRTGQRVGVSTTEIEKMVTVEYAYQESISVKSLENLQERLEAFTPLKEPYINIDVSKAEFIKEDGDS